MKTTNTITVKMRREDAELLLASLAGDHFEGSDETRLVDARLAIAIADALGYEPPRWAVAEISAAQAATPEPARRRPLEGRKKEQRDDSLHNRRMTG